MKTNIKRERFLKIAEQRTNKIISTIKLLGNCSNQSNYEYNEQEVKQIFNAIEEELKRTKKKFDTKFDTNYFKLKGDK